MKIGCVYTESHFLCCWWAFCLDKCGIAWNRGEKREVRLRIQTRICTQHDSAYILEYGSQVSWNRCLYRTVLFWKRLIIIRVRIVLAISCERETYHFWYGFKLIRPRVNRAKICFPSWNSDSSHFYSTKLIVTRLFLITSINSSPKNIWSQKRYFASCPF